MVRKINESGTVNVMLRKRACINALLVPLNGMVLIISGNCLSKTIFPT